MLKCLFRQYDSCPTCLINNYAKYIADPPPQGFKASFHEPHGRRLDPFLVDTKEQGPIA